ncbi:MAG: cytochrome c oxidase subunit 3 family protein [Denitromonas halophila]|nr:MAG: cytochrome c oxidase subunit 3 family protein [Denitromonas halophila]TVT75718.1 MAG: cytochrome c oxidase subunit 3 family protein [Denitromonas halophila]
MHRGRDLPDALGRPELAAGRKPFQSIWIFLVADSVSFGLLFLVFMVERLGQPVLFAESAHRLNALLGLGNTLILITGSWLVALAVAACRVGSVDRTRRRLVAAIVVSSGFAFVKIFEYGSKVGDGITPLTNDFYTFYYALTGFHLLHYLTGMGALIYLAVLTVRVHEIEARFTLWLESAALFWHVVDLLWIFLFAMLYLLGVQT